MLVVNIFLNVVNTASRTVLERHVGWCNHCASWGAKTQCGIDVTSVVLINSILFYFLFYFYFLFSTFLKLKYVFKMCILINSVFNSNLLLIWGCNLAINKASLILRLLTLHTIASILMEKLLSLFLSMEWGCTYVELFFNSYVVEFDCTSYIKIIAF